MNHKSLGAISATWMAVLVACSGGAGAGVDVTVDSGLDTDTAGGTDDGSGSDNDASDDASDDATDGSATESDGGEVDTGDVDRDDIDVAGMCDPCPAVGCPAGQLCFAVEGIDVCLAACDTSIECPRGYACDIATGTGVCVPPGDTCDLDCVDLDGDRAGAGCEAPDCDDSDPEIHPFAIDRCDGIDNDCDGVIDDEGGQNACGGCAVLEHRVGAECGLCDSGTWECDGGNSVVCDGERSADSLNECGGCLSLFDAFGQSCGPCPGGILVCADENSLVCSIESCDDTTWTAIDAGENHTCLVTATGARTCWGRTGFGMLGRAGFGGSSEPFGFAFVSPAGYMGALNNCFVLDADFSCLGDGLYGQLGPAFDRIEEFSEVPVRVTNAAEVADAAVGGVHSCIVKPDGAVACWGSNGTFACGTANDAEELWGSSLETPVGLPLAQAVAAGFQFTCVLTREEGVWCFGENTVGQLGRGATSTRELPARTLDVGELVEIDAVDRSVCGLDADGGVVCWGEGYGSTPQRIAGLPAVRAVSTGGAFGCALSRTGDVHCWGTNFAGQLGQGDFDAHAGVVTVPLRDTAISVAAGLEFACALLSDQSVWCWGANTNRELGGGTTERTYATPVQVPLP